MACAGRPIRRGSPSTRIWPDLAGGAPNRARASAERPDPCSPARPSTSPRRREKETSSNSPGRLKPRTSRYAPPAADAAFGRRSARVRPAIIAESLRRSNSLLARLPSFLPSRSTVIVSESSVSSSSMWLMKMKVMPWAERRRMMPNSLATSGGVRAVVGSSRITRRAWRESTRTSRASCFSAALQSRMSRRASMLSPSRLRYSSSVWRFMVRQSGLKPRRGITGPRNTLAAMDRFGQMGISWWKTLIPTRSASAGSRGRCGRPSKRIRPESGWCTPHSSLIRVDLPAPFSPARPNTSPCWISRDTSCRALVEPKLLETLSTESKDDFIDFKNSGCRPRAEPAAGGLGLEA